MSKCAYCDGHCSAHADEKSHGICPECLAKHCPDCPESRRYMEAMSRGRSAQVRGGMVNLALMGMLAGMR